MLLSCRILRKNVQSILIVRHNVGVFAPFGCEKFIIYSIQANKLSINFGGILYLGVLFDPPPKLIDTSTLCLLPFILSQSFLQVNA